MIALAVRGRRSNYKWGGRVRERFIGSLLFLPLLSGMYRSNKFLQVGRSIIKYEERG